MKQITGWPVHREGTTLATNHFSLFFADFRWFWPAWAAGSARFLRRICFRSLGRVAVGERPASGKWPNFP